MRQMACHPDLVLRSKSNGNTFFSNEELSEAAVCRLCNDIAEDAIQAKCRHIFDRECMKQYLSAAGDINVCLLWIHLQPVSTIVLPSRNAQFVTSP
jgi:DNA repair protein RAD16